jgi:hypothetical protein
LYDAATKPAACQVGVGVGEGDGVGLGLAACAVVAGTLGVETGCCASAGSAARVDAAMNAAANSFKTPPL